MTANFVVMRWLPGTLVGEVVLWRTGGGLMLGVMVVSMHHQLCATLHPEEDCAVGSGGGI